MGCHKIVGGYKINASNSNFLFLKALISIKYIAKVVDKLCFNRNIVQLLSVQKNSEPKPLW